MYYASTDADLLIVQPQALPPASAAAKYHSLPVYYQVQQWIGTETGLLPQDWGWKESDGRLTPVTTDLDPAQFSF